MKIYKEFIYPILVLGGICLVVALLLSLTHKTTEPIIKEQERVAADRARAEVMTMGDTVNADIAFEKVTLSSKLEGIENVYRCELGYAILATSKGFGGTIYVMVGIDNDGKIIKVKLTKHNETPGLGSKVGLTDFTSRFYEKSATEAESADTISGATISSKAFKKAVANAFLAYDNLTK